MRRSVFGKWAFATLLLLAGFFCCAGENDHQRVVLITIDTLRYDMFMGERAQMLMLNTRAFAERGQNFTRFYSASSATQPTHASVFTGLHPWQHGVRANGIELADEVSTVAERMQAAGFRTAAVVASFPLQRRFGFAQGFDLYEDRFSRSIGLSAWGNAQIKGRRFYSLSDEVTNRALALLDSLGGERQFLWVHYFDPHEPYGDTAGNGLSLLKIRRTASERSSDAQPMVEEAREGYERDVGHLDWAVARLLERIDADSSSFETHVVFTADHGESLGEAGVIGHGDHLTLEQVHVPTFIVSPRLEPGLRDDVAGSVDLAPTLLALAGLSSDLAGGRNLLLPAPADPTPALGMRRPMDDPTMYALIDGHVSRLPPLEFFAVRDGDFYRGNADFVERNGKSDDSADVRALFAELAHELEAPPGRQLRDSETLEALEALGYAE